MSYYPKEDVIVFEEEGEDKENDIIVFEEEEEEGTQGMSKKDFDDCCSRLEDRIIFSNLKNFQEGLNKPTPTFFQEARAKRRESEQQRESQRHLPRPRNDRPSLASELPKDVKVDFLKGKQHIPRESVEESLRDELPGVKVQLPGARVDSRACVASRREVRVQEQKERSVLKVSNFREFLYTQLRPGYQVALALKRTEDGLLSTTYQCSFPENGQFVLAVQKPAFGAYIFSTSKVHISEDHITCLAKMDSDLFGREFRLYDAGEDCARTKIMEHYKKQMAFVAYAQDKNSPRQFSALLSTCDNALTDFTVIDRAADNLLQLRWQRGQREHMARLASREPHLDGDGTYKLDFQGVAGVASTKNFILEDEDHPEALIFGRQDKDTYLMQVKAPFSILQAVAVALSSVHRKFL